MDNDISSILGHVRYDFHGGAECGYALVACTSAPRAEASASVTRPRGASLRRNALIRNANHPGRRGSAEQRPVQNRRQAGPNGRASVRPGRSGRHSTPFFAARPARPASRCPNTWAASREPPREPPRETPRTKSPEQPLSSSGRRQTPGHQSARADGRRSAMGLVRLEWVRYMRNPYRFFFYISTYRYARAQSYVQPRKWPCGSRHINMYSTVHSHEQHCT